MDMFDNGCPFGIGELKELTSYGIDYAASIPFNCCIVVVMPS
jgi:hypothetical protein